MLSKNVKASSFEELKLSTYGLLGGSNASYIEPKEYVRGHVSSEIPDELVSGLAVRPISSINRIVQVPTQNGPQSGGGLSQIQISSGGLNFLKSNSSYAQFNVAVQLASVTGTGANAQMSFGNNSMSASSLINRVTVLVAGQQIELMNFYGEYVHPTLLLNRTNQSYLQTDSMLLEHT